MPELGRPALADHTFRPWILVAGVLSLATGVALAPLAVHSNPHTDGEYRLLAVLERHRVGWFNTIARGIEFFDGPKFVPYLLVGMLVALFLLRRRVMALLAVLMPGLGWLPGHFAKLSFQRSRPPQELHPIIVYHDTMSYPSGHTGFITSITVFWIFALTMWGVRRWWVKVAGALLIALVAFSRLYAAAHWPLDVLGGCLLALGTSLILWNPASWLWVHSQGSKFWAEPEHRRELEAKGRTAIEPEHVTVPTKAEAESVKATERGE